MNEHTKDENAKLTRDDVNRRKLELWPKMLADLRLLRGAIESPVPFDVKQRLLERLSIGLSDLIAEAEEVAG